MSRRGVSAKKKMFILFIIDATRSMKNVLTAAHEKAENIACNLTFSYPRVEFHFGCICYRDPVDIATSQNEFLDFDDDIENLSIFLSKIEPKTGGDIPEDFVGALNIAFDSMHWEDGKKGIIWIADSPAHGQRFCGFKNHQEEEEKLVSLVQRLANDEFYFIGISIYKNEKHRLSGASRTFNEMKNIYDGVGSGKSFTIEEFRPDENDEIASLGETLKTTVAKLSTAMMAD